jgi:hypothetical protein
VETRPEVVREERRDALARGGSQLIAAIAIGYTL